MGNISKTLTLLLISTITLSSLIMLEPVSAATKPPVPQFTYKFTEHSFDLAAGYSTDQFTGQQILESPSHHWDWTTLDLVIPNSLQEDTAAGNRLYYQIHCKGLYATDWSYVGGWAFNMVAADSGPTTVFQISLDIDEFDWNYFQNNVWYNTGANFPESETPIGRITAPSATTVEIQVQAAYGYICEKYDVMRYYDFEGEQSGWSPVQDIVLNYDTAPTATPIILWTQPSPSEATSPTQSPSTTPQQQKSVSSTLSWESAVIVVLVALVTILFVVVSVMYRKIAKISKQT